MWVYQAGDHDEKKRAHFVNATLKKKTHKKRTEKPLTLIGALHIERSSLFWMAQKPPCMSSKLMNFSCAAVNEHRSVCSDPTAYRVSLSFCNYTATSKFIIPAKVCITWFRYFNSYMFGFYGSAHCYCDLLVYVGKFIVRP